jgi:hypothetical protein
VVHPGVAYTDVQVCAAVLWGPCLDLPCGFNSSLRFTTALKHALTSHSARVRPTQDYKIERLHFSSVRATSRQIYHGARQIILRLCYFGWA